MAVLWVLVVLLALVAAFVAGEQVQKWRRWRRLTPDQQEQERLADKLLRQARQLPTGAVRQDPVTRRWFGIERRRLSVAIGVIEAKDMGAADGVVTWYVIARSGTPRGVARVLRHQKPAGEPSGLATRTEAYSLVEFEKATGAVGADTDELALVLEQLSRAAT